MFVSSHGGQSEIVLRVKQGDNPTFGFLMPDNHLHAYFRYLVDHPNLLTEYTYPKEAQDKTSENEENTEPIAAGGALSLLGFAYGSADDDAVASQPDLKEMKSDKSGTPGNQSPCRLKHEESSTFIVSEDKETSNVAIDNNRILLSKRNPVMKYASFSVPNCSKGGDTRPSASAALDGSQASDIKPLLVDPPSVLKEAIDKIVEFIIRNGKQFEAVLIEQDKSAGRFPFLLPSNQYNSYYLRRLEEEHESKRMGKNNSERKHDAAHDAGKKGKQKSPNKGSDSYDSDLGERSEGSPSGLKMKEKFGTTTGGANKYTHDRPPRQPRLSADDVAAIILAATRGSSPASADQHPTPARQSGASADEAAAIVLAATRGMSPASADQLLAHGKQHGGVVATARGASPAKVGPLPNPPRQFAVNTAEDAGIFVTDSKGSSPFNSLKSMLIEELHASRPREDSGQYSSSRSFSSFEGNNTLSTCASRGETDKSLHTGKRDKNSSNTASDVLVAKVIANTVARAATNEANSDQACLTKEQKQKAERLKRAKIFAAVIKSGAAAVSDSGLSRKSPSGSLMVSNDVASHSNAELKIRDRKREVTFDSGDLDTMKSQERDNRTRKAYLSRSREKLDVSDDDCSTPRKRYRSTHYPHQNRDNHQHHRYHHASRNKEVRHLKHHSVSEDEYKHRKRSSFPHRYKDDLSEDDDDDEQIRSDIHPRKQRSHSGKQGGVKTLDRLDNPVGSSNHNQDGGSPIASDAPPSDVTDVPTELRDKIRAMLLERI